MPEHPPSEEIVPNPQSKPPLVQLEPLPLVLLLFAWEKRSILTSFQANPWSFHLEALHLFVNPQPVLAQVPPGAMKQLREV